MSPHLFLSIHILLWAEAHECGDSTVTVTSWDSGLSAGGLLWEEESGASLSNGKSVGRGRAF